MELVGRRFLCVSAGEERELGGVTRWGWRAGLIRAVTSRHTDSPTLAVCVEWDGEPSAECKWRRLREEWEVFVLEHELVWAKRNSTSQENSSPQPALVFRPLIGQAHLDGVAVVEYLSDRKLEFYTEREELRPYEGEADGDNSPLSEDLSSHIQAWLRHRQLQHILQLGHSSVKGLRVKVFRPDSKPQWLHGIVSHHDHSRTMTVLSEQVAEPLSVDPALMHVLVLDDVSQLLLVEDNAAKNCKPHTNKISSITVNAGNGPKNTTGTDQVCSSGPVQRKQPELCRENTNCSLTEDDTGRMREENSADEARADSSKSRINCGERKKRKAGDMEKQDDKDSRSAGLKRPKGNFRSDQSECSDSESTIMDTKILERNCSKKPGDSKIVNNPAAHLGLDMKAHSSPKSIELSSCQLAEIECQKVGKVMPLQGHLSSTPCNGVYQTINSLPSTMGLGCNKAEMEEGDGVMEMKDQSEGASQEDCEAVSALLASQENEQMVSLETACVLLHTSPPECEGVDGEQEIPPGEPAVRMSNVTCPEVITSSCDSADAAELKSSQSPEATSPRHDAALASEITHKTTVLLSPCSSLEVISKPPEVTEVSRLKCNVSPQTIKIEESSLHSKVITDKVLSGFKSTHGSKVTPTPTLHQQNASSPSTTDTKIQSRTSPQNVAHNLNHTPTPDKLTKSSLIVDRNEPFTVYRDPALVRRELESLSTYVQPPHTPPSLHSKHHLKSSSPSSSSPSLTCTTSHTIMSPAAHISPLPLPSQSPLCSAHPSIPHPHLLPSLLPGLPPSSALLAGHGRLGPLGLPPHPLALQGTPSLLGQGPGSASLAPMGLYPVLWPPFPNGVHSYGLGIPGSKWTPSETAGISEIRLRRNTPSPWVPQTSPVTIAESQGLRPPLPVRPSSAEPQRPTRSSQPSTHSSKSTEEQKRRAFTETQSPSDVLPKPEQERVRTVVRKNGHTSHTTVTESPSAHSKQPQLVYDLTGDHTSCYQEESRRILQESIEVAPFTAKLSSDREPYPKSPTPSLHFKEKEKERHREREMHVFRQSMPPRLQSAQPSPTLTQSSYYIPAAGSVENKASARRAPPSKELYERLSSPNTTSSVLSSNSTQSTMKGRPPPLVKRNIEREEGLLGKITEQVISKSVSLDPLDVSSMERKGSTASLISVSSSSYSSSRVVHSLHRAPIFHPPALPIVTSKEAGQGRLSPPTLTPVQPMSLFGKGQNQHRPPTLMPELRHGTVAGKKAAPEPITIAQKGYDLQRGGGLHNRERTVGGHTTNGGLVNTQVATASVIVRSSGYMDTSVNHTITERSHSQFHCDHVRTFEALPSTHSKDGNGQCKRGILWTPVDTIHPANMVALKQDLNTPLNMTKNMSTHFSNRGVKYSINMQSQHSRIDLVSDQCEKEKEEISRVVQPKMNLSCFPLRDVPHVKKRRAGLAALEPMQNMLAVQPLHTTETFNTTKSRHSCTTHSTHTKCTAHTLDQHKESIFHPSPPKYPRLAPEVTGVVANKPSSVAKVQPLSLSVPSIQPAQSNNYHKLKKAWLTRHSEQYKGSATPETAGGSTTLTTTTTVSLPIKQEVNGLEHKWHTQEGKEHFLDNRKSKTLDRKCLVEDRKPNGCNVLSNTDDKKTPLTGDNKMTLENMKPTMDRNSILHGKKTNIQKKKLCINIRKPNPADLKLEKDNHEEKQIFQSSFESESGGDSGSESECHRSDSASIHRYKPSFKKNQNDQRKQRGENEKVHEEEEGEEDEGKLHDIIQTSKEKSQHRMPSNGIPRSVLKDWRKVRKLKQSGEAFLQDDSCAEIGANVQKCRECRLDRSRKSQEPVFSPVFCRFYYFRRLSYSKNGVVRVDGFSVVEDTDEEAVRVWVAGFEAEEDHKQKEMELDTAKYILTLIGDKFCQLIKTENTAVTWVKKDSECVYVHMNIFQVMWKRAVRGVREMCDACEATLFNIHWACHKCGFVVCMDCYKARERKSAKDKELYAWVRCVKNQPHDLKNLMPTQIVPERVLADLQSTMHSIRREYGIPSQCSCFGSSAFLSRSTITNGLLQLSERTQCDLKSQQQNQQKTTQNTAHKISTERKGKLECDDLETLGRKSGIPEQGSTLRDLLTSTAGKLRLGSTGPGIVFAPVYNSIDQTAQKTRMPNLLDDIIASVVENKIPASKMTKLGLNQDLLTEKAEELVLKEEKPIRIPLADPHTSVPHDWIGRHRLLWLKDYHHQGNQRLFKENWTQEQPVLVSGLHKSLNASLWKPEHFSREFSALHSDFYNCRDGSIINTCVKEFWDGFEDVSKRTNSAKGDPAVYRLKDWPSGEEFLALMPSRHEDVMRLLPVPEYTGPDGTLNLASRLPSFFIRPDLGPRLCCAHGVTACPEQDFGTSNLHVEISDTMSILVYVGVAKGNGALSKSGLLKLLEKQDLDESANKRLRDPNETPGALWHIYLSKDLHKIQEFLQTIAMERAEADAEADSEAEWESEADPLREGSWYLSPKLRQRLLDEHGVESRTLLQFHGDTVIIPAGALHQVMNLHSCIQVNVDFVSPEHAHNSYYLTQELRPLKDQVNYEDKLQVKNIFYHSVKDAVAALSRYLKEQSAKEVKEEEC